MCCVGAVSTIAGSGASTYADGVGTAAAMYGPLGLAMDMNGNLIVADQDNNRIRKLSYSSKYPAMSTSLS